MRCKPSGPTPASILVVGEAPGADEEFLGVPFVGASGQELKRMLSQAGIDPKSVRYTNVFMDRPDGNRIENFCAKRKEVGKDYHLPPLSQGNYVVPDRLHELARLRDDIEECDPTLILAVGNTPCWALLKRTGISKLRGNLFPCELASGRTVLPTYHPAAILRDWSLRVVAVQDFLKAERYVREGITLPRRELWLDPTLDEVQAFFARELRDRRPELLAFDIETFAGTITCIGFSPRPECALTVPFFDPRRTDRNYWPSAEDEIRAWKLCKEVLEGPLPKVGQNGLYDLQYLYRFGIRVRNYQHDTMIRHHTLYPELPKGLGFMGSIYTDEAPWKIMRARGKEQLKIGDD